MFTFKVKAVPHRCNPRVSKGAAFAMIANGFCFHLLSEQVVSICRQVDIFHINCDRCSEESNQRILPVQGKVRLFIDRQSQSTVQQKKSQINKKILAANIKT